MDIPNSLKLLFIMRANLKPLSLAHLVCMLAIACLQRCMTDIFADSAEEIMEVFMDNFSAYGTSFNYCLHNLGKVVQRCEDTSLVLNWRNATSW
jgi:hypothetical protein